MDWNSIWTFLTTPGNGDRIVGLAAGFIIVSAMAGIFIGYVWSEFLSFLKTIVASFKRKEKTVEVIKYATPPANKEIDKYLEILKKIVDDYSSKIKL